MTAPLLDTVSPAMREVIAAVDDVASTTVTVLLVGESGTGKEVLAREIHRRSDRAGGPWVAVNCAALPAELLESELFGHERGAFTGASERRTGRFEQAHGGTLLLDEVSELPLALQAKLLRVLQEREVDRVGGSRPVPVDVRVIASTNRELPALVAGGSFRADLFYRLDVFPIHLPPLRRRPEDLPRLAAHLVDALAAELGRPAAALSPEAMESLLAHRFPGNVRELRNVLARALLRSRGGMLGPEHLRLSPGPTAPPETPFTQLPLELPRLEQLAIAEALRRCRGNRTHAARMLGIGLRTLRNKLRETRSGVCPPLSTEVHA
ncbi:MAG TPA: sigma-54 dependent transcriptional regulator [Myxococcaceae bacterium]|nr:sigma-54 dependent transcriptional regulator [Myxococcaceae bacterium]